MDYTYTYDKPVNPSKLDRELKSSSLASSYKGLYTVGTAVNVVFSVDLPQLSINDLDALVNGHNVVDQEAFVAGKIHKAKEFGANLVVEFGTRNILAALTTAEITEMMITLEPVISALGTGSLNVAVSEMDKITPTALIPIELITEYKTKILAFLASI
jgi:hypothetical protein